MGGNKNKTCFCLSRGKYFNEIPFWKAAFYLAEWCIANRERFNGMSVIELGSGAGLVGLACYKICQPRFITLTDFHPKVMETLSYNLETNKLITLQSDSSIHMQSLDWIEYSTNGNGLQADMVLASGNYCIKSHKIIEIMAIYISHFKMLFTMWI